MSAILVRNIPEDVHETLRGMAAKRGLSVEAFVRTLLGEAAREARPTGIDFAQIAADRAQLGLTEDGPEWTDELDDPALSRRLLGLDQ
ncbi:MAG: FitA-like ribbon-helix-helix domain-containing protein [Vitreimonas sp.]